MSDETEALERAEVVDSRDIIARIEYLESARDAGEPCEWSTNRPHPETGYSAWVCNTHMYDGTGEFPANESHPNACPWAGEPLTDDESQELTELLALQDEASGAADWTYGETLIRDDYFEDYARQLAEDIGAIDPNASWPLTYIDWESAARALQMDYSSVDWAGETYWIRY